MNRLTTIVLTFALVALVGTGAQALIANSAHDFSLLGWNSGGEICQPCHTPHNAVTLADAPLWNHDVTGAAFTPYTSSTMNAVTGAPSGVSLLCLSCHDGTVALDSFGGATGTNFIAGTALVDSDLSNDHPISFTYNAALATADGELFDPSSALSGLPGGGTIDADLLFGGSMECASCHDVHNTIVGINPFLLHIDNDASVLCLTCHNK